MTRAMTPPAPAVSTTALPPQRAATRLRAVPPHVPAAWRCDNCDLPNVARRRRCTDCGTSRH
jgi:hypothetical protein